ncbi:MAG: tRNA (cytidine(34)-2'-O)-methyltransferase [Spirochaetales bacterium]|nr:tRNA (cytidine(34)-2'-O)-methyltransferase [Spirochaetales bacterium]
MIHLVLHEPEIPQNTGNIARTCGVLGAKLHLIGPLGFSIDEKSVKRAGLDYWHLVDLEEYNSWEDFFRSCSENDPGWEERTFCLTTKARYRYDQIPYPDSPYLVFGKETKGLPVEILQWAGSRAIRIPMRSGARSLNLSNAVAICAFEVARQNDFEGLQIEGPSYQTSGR